MFIPDLSGYGESEVKAGVVLLDELALDIIHLLETLEINKAFFVGLSMAGQIALEIYRMKPLLFKGLVLADTDARSESEEGYNNRMTLAQRIEDYGMAKFIKERINKFMCQHTFNTKPEVVTFRGNDIHNESGRNRQQLKEEGLKEEIIQLFCKIYFAQH